MRINVRNLVNDATRRAHATDPRAKQKQVSGWQAAELARQFFLGLARHNDADVCALMRRYRPRLKARKFISSDIHRLRFRQGADAARRYRRSAARK